VTSPPYWGLRDYGCPGQLGLEATPEEYVAHMVEVFRLVREVLTRDGSLWLNLGDSYANDGKWGGSSGGKHASGLHGSTGVGRGKRLTGLKPKDLVGIPWMVAFALRSDGWYLRSDIIWSKPNPMPESVRDRPTKAHEYVFLLSKGPRYYFGQEAVREDGAGRTDLGKMTNPARLNQGGPWTATEKTEPGRNVRSVWEIATQPCAEAHFATMPPALAERCILAGSEPGDTVLDPFTGSGTTLGQAVRLGRRGVGCELNADYIEIANRRICAMLGTVPEQVGLFGGGR